MRLPPLSLLLLLLCRGRFSDAVHTLLNTLLRQLVSSLHAARHGVLMH